MPLEPGARIGPYFIDREIGRGGMGVVYLAKDPRLQRDVAIKALPDHVAEDPSRLERFQSEAQALAQLNHPSVAGIHGVEEEGGLRYLVLEYVEGETLSDRLARGPLAVDEAIDLGIRIASGVEAAHEAGVVHRDLKPDNIRLTPEGEVKVLDFGLAKVGDGGGSSSGLSATVAGPAQHSPTMPGTILGTAAYMSPEQARGRGVDRRTDVWAFGVVLYECLTGASPFAGDSASDSIGAVLHKDVDFDRLPAETPAHVRRVLSRCLVRDKARRLRDMGDVRLELETGDGEAGAAVVSAATSRATTIALAAIAILAAAGWGFTALRAPAPAEDSPVHLSITLPDGMEIYRSIDISPDGRTVVFSGRMDGEQWIYLRSLDGFDLRRVGSSRDGFEPTFSPDGSSILFYARGQIFRASVSGGNPVSLARASWMMADWDEDGAIVFSEGLGSPLRRMPAGGGEATPVTNLADDGAYAHVWPKRIPGTSKVLFTSWTTAESGGARILDLDTGEMRPLAAEMPDQRFTPTPRWSASGHLILENWDAGLSVLPFDPASDERVSIADARPLLGSVFHMGNSTRSVFALSDEGTFVYAPGFLNAGRRLVWVDEDGTVTPIVDQRDVSGGRMGGIVSLAPDGTTVVTGMGTDLVEVDLRRGISRQLTFDGGNELRPMYFPEGDRVLYSSNVDVRWSLWTVGRGSAATPEMLLQRDENTYGLDVAIDGTILFAEQSQDTGDDVYLLMPDGEVRPLVVTPSDENQAVFSTDGRWVAYQSDVSGRSEVYLTDAGGTSAPVQVSSGGGTSPQFGPGGQTLYFRRHRQVLRVGFADGQPIGEAEQVFDAPNLAVTRAYDFVADESRMIAVQVDEAAVPTELRVVTGFFRVIEDLFDDGAR